MLSLDTETTGIDLKHGAKPFLVTVCNDDLENRYWEWDVNPLTREPVIPSKDIKQIRRLVGKQRLAMQNSNFDIEALETIGVRFNRWNRLNDTLIAGHLLASNQSHDLASMAITYLGVDIEPVNKQLEKAVKEAQRLVRRKFPKWRLAKKGLPEMPSAKEKTWKFDSWLLRAVAKHLGYNKSHPWWTLCSEYANTDSLVTRQLITVQLEEIERRGLTEIYKNRLKLLPIVNVMRRQGVTLNGKRLERQTEEYKEGSASASRKCVRIAESLGFDLTMPKGGNNNSLLKFAQDDNGLNLPSLVDPQDKHSNKGGAYGKSGQISLGKDWLERYEQKLRDKEPKGKRVVFIRNLMRKRKYDTAINYMEGYKRYWLPYRCNGVPVPDWFILFPSINPTGTDTLRWSSSNPNQQNISKQEGFNLRYCFGPAPGREWWSLDAKNIELRIPAYESGEQELITLFENPNKPPYYGSEHLLNFSTVYSDIWDKELKAVGIEKVGQHIKEKYKATWYQWCKNGDFAVQYGAVNRTDITGTADRAFHRRGSHARLMERFRRKEKLNQYWIDFAEKHGYVETIPDKDVDPNRGYPLQCPRASSGGIRPTVPLNYRVSGSAMWWMGQAMIRCQEYLDRLNESAGCIDYWIVLQVHDELVFDFPYRSDLGNISKVEKLKRLMERGGKGIGIPTPVGIEYHDQNWSVGVGII